MPRYQHRANHLAHGTHETWQQAATGKWKRVDYICAQKWVTKFIRSCRVFIGPSAEFDTDHRLLVMNIEFPAGKKNLCHQLHRTKLIERKPTLDLRALRDSREIQQKLTDRLERELESLNWEFTFSKFSFFGPKFVQKALKSPFLGFLAEFRPEK